MQNLATSINRLVQFLNSQFSPPSQKPWSELPRWGVVFRTRRAATKEDLLVEYSAEAMNTW